MTWTRIDDKFLMNPKVQSVGVHGMALYLSGLIYCNGNMTDGFIMDGMMPIICGMAFQTPARHIADKLVEMNLWEVVEGGYQIHDFLTFNKSKTEIESLNKARANNGAKGGRLAKQPETELLSKQVSKQVSKQPPIIPNPLSLIPNDKELPPPQEVARVGEIFKLYENEIGVITPSVADSIKSALEDYPYDWFKVAMKEAAMNNKRNWRYVEAILIRWKVDGFMVDARATSRKPTAQKVSAGHELDYILEGVPIFAEDKR